MDIQRLQGLAGNKMPDWMWVSYNPFYVKKNKNTKSTHF